MNTVPDFEAKNKFVYILFFYLINPENPDYQD